jgi:hypothetical protein
MIFSIILKLLSKIFGMLIALLPTIEILPSQITTTINWLSDQLAGFLYIFPASATFLVIIQYVVICEVSIMAYKSFVFVTNLVRGAGN